MTTPTETPTENHCRDCCCARSWKALGITEYTGKSIPEHIAELKSQLTAIEQELHKAEMAVGDEHREFSVDERVRNLAMVKDYFVRMTDKARSELTAATAQLEIYRQETHRWSEAHRAVEAGELKRLAERFQCAPEHAATAALAFATTTETPLTSALFASLPAYTQETLKFMPLCEQLEKKLTAATAQLEEARKALQIAYSYIDGDGIDIDDAAEAVSKALAAMQQKEKP